LGTGGKWPYPEWRNFNPDLGGGALGLKHLMMKARPGPKTERVKEAFSVQPQALNAE